MVRRATVLLGRRFLGGSSSQWASQDRLDKTGWCNGTGGEMLRQLGPYKIDRLVGRGGMGAVYAGTHVDTGEKAAIKVLAVTLAEDPNFRARFLAEIETLKQLRHPHIVQMIGDGEEDGNLFFVMELVEGQSLQEVLQSGYVFSWREVVRIAVEICSALKHAHDCGVIHRDLKPANLLRLPDGQVKLTDFGIAKLFGATHRTADGSVVGTADYMAPEQADGRGVTHRTDLYSLGAVMFTLLGRRPPFAGGTLPQVIHKLKYEAAPSVRRYAPETPEELDQLIAELLQKDPQQRPVTALVLANRLRSMEHALLIRGDGPGQTRGDTTQVREESDGYALAGDDATQPSLPLRPPNTQVSPTISSESVAPESPQYSWNDATVGTSPPQRRTPPAADATVAEAATPMPVEKRNRFTTLNEHLRQAEMAEQAQDTSTSDHRSAWLIAVVLLGIVALCVWGMWPASADSLYARIQTHVGRGEPADAIKDIEAFVARFPDDARFAEVEGWRRDVDCQWLASRLGLRKRKSDGQALAAYESQWLAAFHLREKDPAAARRELERLVHEYSTQTDQSANLTAVLAASEHLLFRLPKTAAPPAEPGASP